MRILINSGMFLKFEKQSHLSEPIFCEKKSFWTTKVHFIRDSKCLEKKAMSKIFTRFHCFKNLAEVNNVVIFHFYLPNVVQNKKRTNHNIKIGQINYRSRATLKILSL